MYREIKIGLLIRMEQRYEIFPRWMIEPCEWKAEWQNWRYFDHAMGPTIGTI